MLRSALVLSAGLAVAMAQNTLVLTGGGSVPFLAQGTSEAIDMSGNGLFCQAMPSLPNDAYAAMGASTGGRPVVCGGQHRLDENSGCYVYNETYITWDALAEMDHNRRSGASVQLTDDDFWIVGGYQRGHIKATEIFDSSIGEFVTGPDLPYGVDQHCMAKVNETHFILSGGETDLLFDYTTQVIMWNSINNHWDVLPDMAIARGNHGCGVAMTANGPEYVVAGGTSAEDSTFYSSQIYNVDSGEWRTGPPLPEQIRGTTSVAFGETFLLTGGFDEHDNGLHSILEYDAANEAWIERAEHIGGLILGRGFHAASFADDSLNLCA